MSINLFLEFLALMMLSFASVGANDGCTCIGPGDAKEGLELSDAVFSGRVIKANGFKAEVEVERVWKGTFTKARVIVFNPAPRTSCSMTLARGQRYIVFASVDKEKGVVSYIPKICFPTSVLSKAEQTLKEIGEGQLFKKQRRSLGRRRSTSTAADSPPLTLSHAFIVVTTGAPERKALERAGFRIAPMVNRHDGQGTASVTVELLNGYLELVYPDPTVPVSAAFQAGAEKFRLKSAWRGSGYSPIAIVFERTSTTPEKFPFATWRISPDWMEKGTFMEMMTPKEMPKAVSLSIHPQSTSESENEKLARDPIKGRVFLHPNGARRLTGIRVVAPSAEGFPPAASYLAGLGLVKFDVGSRWLLEVTLDNRKQRKTKRLEPELPMVIHY